MEKGMSRETMIKRISMIRRMSNADKCQYDEKFAAAREITVGECLEFMDQWDEGPHRQSLILRGIDICPSPFSGGGMTGAASMAAPIMVAPKIKIVPSLLHEPLIPDPERMKKPGKSLAQQIQDLMEQISSRSGL